MQKFHIFFQAEEAFSKFSKIILNRSLKSVTNFVLDMQLLVVFYTYCVTTGRTINIWCMFYFWIYIFSVDQWYVKNQYADISSTGHFPDWHFPEDRSPTDTSQMDISLNGQFLDRTLPQWRLPRLNISPLRHFPNWTFLWPYVLVRLFLKKFVSNPFLFVCTSIY